MSNNWDLDDFDFDNKPNPISNKSLDWDNFDAPHNSSLEHSEISQVFNQTKKSLSKKEESGNFEDSRDIMEISIANSQNKYGSFKFEKEDTRGYPKPNQRYINLQKILEVEKKNNLELFYKAIDQENKAYPEEAQRFIDYSEFKSYIQELKKEKKRKETNNSSQQTGNPFGTASSSALNPFSSIISNNNHGNGEFGSAQENEFGTFNQFKEEHQNQPPQKNFMKKTSQNNIYSSGLFPNDEYESNYFDSAKEISERNKPKSKRSIESQEKFKSSKTDSKNSRKDEVFNFDDFESPKSSAIDSSVKNSLKIISKEKIERIPTEKKTKEEEKLKDLMEGYQSMRKQFEKMMGELKSTTEGQTEIVNEIQKLKDKRFENQMKEEKKMLKEQMEQDIVQKNQKLDQIKEEISKIKDDTNDILYEQINKKIEGLETIMRLALDEINADKEPKIVPKVTNYFCDHIKEQKLEDKELRSKENEFQPIEANKKKEKLCFSRSSSRFNKEYFQEQNSNVFSEEQTPEKRIEFSRIKKQSNPRSPHEDFKKSFQSAEGNSENSFSEIFSPLDVHFQHNESENSYEQETNEFLVDSFAEEYVPKELEDGNSNLRNNLLQKSSIVFENFDFQISTKFFIVDDETYPIVASIKIANKCSIDIYDIHAIVYGSQESNIEKGTFKLFQEEIKKNSSFTFEVFVDETSLIENGFSVEMSYRTDCIPERKIKFRINLPLIQFIRPEFVYEEKFCMIWRNLQSELFLKPEKLSTCFRSCRDLKLILPFIDVCLHLIEFSQENPRNNFYGLVFRYPKCNNLFLIKLVCYPSGEVSVHLRAQREEDRKFQEEVLNVFNYLLFESP